MAGLSCAQELRRRGHDTALFDKGRGPGGRMSTRRIETPLGQTAFDHGAQYFTARDPAFVAQVVDWAKDGHVACWATVGTDAWVGTPSMNVPIKTMAEDCDVRWNARIDALRHDGGWWIEDETFDAIVIAVPAEQVPPLVDAHDSDLADAARSAVSDPCWTVMAAFDRPIPSECDRLTNLGAISSAIRDSAKPGRTGPEAWVLQASAQWSQEHLEDEPDAVERALLALLAQHTCADPTTVIATSTHRWRYAKAGALERGPVWNATIKLGACGDWLLQPRIEAAWLSGQQLALLICNV